MITLGVDLTPEAKFSDIYWITRASQGAEATRIDCGGDDHALLAAIMQADKVGIHVPLPKTTL